MAISGIGNSDSLFTQFGLAKSSMDDQKVNSDFASKLENATKAANSIDSKEKAKLMKVCREMESVFLNYMMTTMRATVPKNGLTSGGFQEGIMQSMLDTELTRNMAQAGGIGLADMIYRQLSTSTDSQKTSQAPK